MLIKSADDKSSRLKLLTELQQSALLDAFQKNWLKSEVQRQKRGGQGERDAAFYIDSWSKDSENHAVLHDLRFEVDGEVAQIDHLVINRTQRFYLFETKCFNGQVHINEAGEFAVEYPGERMFGVPSPLEQSRRHERILSKLLERLGISGRAGLTPTFHHIVMVHPKALIHRPDAKRFDTSNVIKADMIARWHEEHIERLSTVHLLGQLMNIHSGDSLKEWAQKLARQHRPADPLQLPDFMAPKASQQTAAPVTPSVPTARSIGVQATTSLANSPSEPSPPDLTGHPLYRKLVCASCQTKISYPEGKFCWNQEKRFKGLQYCRPCQASSEL
ncbi:NERD domain-containing protein [Paucibacter sp. Y2R2-4]|nr:NERD domain-containing protein [Paucibacter sp. Y2R2-4]